MVAGSGNVDSVIRLAIQAEVEHALGRLKEGLDERTAALDQKIQDLSCRFDEAARTACDNSAKLTSEFEASIEQLQTNVEKTCRCLKSQINRLEFDDEGPGGLQQLRVRLEAVGKDIVCADSRINDQVKISRDLRGRVDTSDDLVGELSLQLGKTIATSQKSVDALQQLQTATNSLDERHRALDDGLTQRHEKLWQNVHQAVEQVRNDHRAAIQADISQRKNELKDTSRSHVNYVTQMLANVHSQRRSVAACKGLFQVWREETWAETRRKTGFRWMANALARMTEKREKAALDRWSRATAIRVLADQLREEHRSQQPDVLQIIEDTGLKRMCSDLYCQVKDARECIEKKSSEASVTVKFVEFSAQLKARSAETEAISTRIEAIAEEQKAITTNSNDKHQTHQEALATHRADFDTQLKSYASTVSTVQEQIASCSTSESHQSLTKDVLFLWNSLKQLDAAKADKAIMDALALEVSASCESTIRNSEHVHTNLREESIRRAEEMQTRLDAGIGHWESMWTKLTGLVEETVSKVAELQSTSRVSTSRKSPLDRSQSPTRDCRGGRTMRPSSLPPTPGRSNTPMPISSFKANLPRAGSASTLGASGLNSGSGFSDGGDGSAPAEIKVGRIRPSSRPSSASSHRPPISVR